MIARSGTGNAKQAHEVNTAQKKKDAFISTLVMRRSYLAVFPVGL